MHGRRSRTTLRPSRCVSHCRRNGLVAHVTMLKLTVPGTVDIGELEHEIVTAVADRLRDTGSGMTMDTS